MSISQSTKARNRKELLGYQLSRRLLNRLQLSSLLVAVLSESVSSIRIYCTTFDAYVLVEFTTDIAAVHPTKTVTLLHSRDRLLPRFDEAMHTESKL